jgi:hypothetical protein
MPGIDGIETARRLGASHPEAVIVLVSLTSAVDVRPLPPDCGAAEFVRKQDFCPKLLTRLWASHRRR